MRSRSTRADNPAEMRGPWRMTGIDPEGCDIVLGADARRILFAAPVLTPGDARKELVRLVNEARESSEA